MRLYGNGILLNALATRITLEKSRGEAAATLTVTLLKAVADRFVKKESLAVGDRMQLLDDAGSEIFSGTVEAITRTPETVTLTACDAGLYLTRNEIYGVFAGSPEAICRAAAGKAGVAVGTIDAPAGYKSLVIRAGVSAFSVLRQVVGEDREISVRDGRLTVEKTGETVISLAPEQVISSSGTASVAQMVNKCVVIGRKGGIEATAQNAEDIARCGQRQRVLGKSGDAQAQAKAALKGRVMRGELVLRGDLRYRCGVNIALNRAGWGIDGVYPIVAVKRMWKRGVFTSEITWEASK